MEIKQLGRCPSCGREVWIEKYATRCINEEYLYQVFGHDPSCEAPGGWFGSEAKAINDWNEWTRRAVNAQG